MIVSTSNKTDGIEIGASVFAPVAPEEIYRAVLDVRGFPAWAPGVRRVEVLSGEGEAGMVSRWEVSFLGFRRSVLSVLEDARSPSRLRWRYEGPVGGWGECLVEGVGDGAVVVFRTEISPSDPLLTRLARGGVARNAARDYLRRSLLRLGRLVSGGESRVLVGPIAQQDARDAVS